MLENGELIYKIILASFVMPIVLSGGLLWFFVTYNKKKNEYLLSLKDEELKRQKLTIEKQTALEAERTRIAAEMHDDLGGGLTTIKFLSQKVLRKMDDDKDKTQVRKILTNAQTLVTNMSEIIWAMNSGFDTLDNLIAYSRRYAYEYLEDYPIKVQFTSSGSFENIPLRGEQRRNIFLIIKEALHNTVKYAEASEVKIAFSVQDSSLHISISDNGVGLTDEENLLGNGLKNMEARVAQMNGSFSTDNNKGLTIAVKIPIEIHK